MTDKEIISDTTVAQEGGDGTVIHTVVYADGSGWMETTGPDGYRRSAWNADGTPA